MCLICVQLEENKLTSVEARRNLGELIETLEKEHIHEVLQNIWKKEDQEYEEAWYNYDNDQYCGDSD